MSDSKKYIPKQGDIVWFNSNPTSGREITKHRSGLIVSGDEYNITTEFIVIAPITSTSNSTFIKLPDELTTKGYINFLQMKSIDYLSANRQVAFKEKCTLEVLGRTLIGIESIFNLFEILN
jgi:mRNA interferase MazF